MGHRRGVPKPVTFLAGWLRRRSMRTKVTIGAIAALLSLVVLWLVVHNRDHFFIAAEGVHAAGILVLAYKLTRQKSCSGLSLKSQELTALFLLARLGCSFVFEKDIHTVLDCATLIFTLWVIYMIRFKLKSSYLEDLDSMALYKLVVPCLVLAAFIHPHSTSGFYIIHFAWAFCVYLESVSVFPQLLVMQNSKIVEPFTAHYVFALGLSRFLGFAYWIIQVIESRGGFLINHGTGSPWIVASVVVEQIQTFILADFCYYYIKSSTYDQLLSRITLAV